MELGKFKLVPVEDAVGGLAVYHKKMGVGKINNTNGGIFVDFNSVERYRVSKSELTRLVLDDEKYVLNVNPKPELINFLITTKILKTE